MRKTGEEERTKERKTKEMKTKEKTKEMKTKERRMVAPVLPTTAPLPAISRELVEPARTRMSSVQVHRPVLLARLEKELEARLEEGVGAGAGVDVLFQAHAAALDDLIDAFGVYGPLLSRIRGAFMAHIRALESQALQTPTPTPPRIPRSPSPSPASPTPPPAPLPSFPTAHASTQTPPLLQHPPPSSSPSPPPDFQSARTWSEPTLSSSHTSADTAAASSSDDRTWLEERVTLLMAEVSDLRAALSASRKEIQRLQ